MKEEMRLSQSIGKTISGFSFGTSGQAVIAFTDDTFATLGVELSYGDADIKEEALELFSFGDDDLISAGVITREELEKKHTAINEARAEADRKRQEERDRKEFERLSAKFATEQGGRGRGCSS